MENNPQSTEVQAQVTQLLELNLICTKSLTRPKRSGKAPRDVYLITGQTQGFEALFRDLGGHLYRGQWSFWDDPTQAILARSGERMSFDELQEYKSDRKLAKAERYRGYAESAEDRSNAASERVRQITDRIPFGQPILVGHHSERAARADQKRIERGMSKSVSEGQKAKYFERQSASLERQAGHTHSIRFVCNRIEEKTAEVAKLKRLLNGQYYAYSRPGSMPVSEEYRTQLTGRLLAAEEALAHWTRKKAAFGDGVPSPSIIRVGMTVRSWAGWNRVLRVNSKSVTILDRWPSGTEFKRTIKYQDIREFRSHSDVTQEAL